MQDLTLVLLTYLAILVIVISLSIFVMLRYNKRKKNDYVHRDDYVIDDFYRPKK